MIDVIIEKDDKIVLIKRGVEPFKGRLAIPGGYVEWGETVEHATIREAKEETCLDIELVSQFGAYSEPARDPRHHTITVVFEACAAGNPVAADDATEIGIFNQENLPHPLAFDHARIIEDFFRRKYAWR